MTPAAAKCILVLAIVASVAFGTSEEFQEFTACLKEQFPKRSHTIIELQKCFDYSAYTDIINSAGFMQDPRKDLEEIVSKGCNYKGGAKEDDDEIPYPVRCVLNVTNPIVDTCASKIQEDVEALREDFENALEATFEYLCDDDAALVKEFFAEKGFECFYGVYTNRGQNLVNECKLTKKMQEAHEEMTADGSVDEIECRMIAELLECADDHLHCESERPIEIVSGLIEKIMRSHSVCSKYFLVDSAASIAGSASVLLVALSALLLPIVHP